MNCLQTLQNSMIARNDAVRTHRQLLQTHAAAAHRIQHLQDKCQLASKAEAAASQQIEVLLIVSLIDH
jgi:hypothetical protein